MYLRIINDEQLCVHLLNDSLVLTVGASPKTYRKWVALRNYAVGPLAEELIYRAAVAFLLAQCLPRAVFIALTPPLFFGAAHLHHYFELRHSGHPSRVALAAVCASAPILVQSYSYIWPFCCSMSGVHCSAVALYS